MRSIKLSEKDYKLLMELSKELQTQENDYQAFPYFWGPRSTKEVVGTEDDTAMVFDNDTEETYTLEDYSHINVCLFKKFLEDEGLDLDTEYEDIDNWNWSGYIDNWNWSGCIDDCDNPDLTIVYVKDEQVSDINFSLFKSDVKNYIESNKHHLGRNPHTYANTIHRMGKMEQLVKIIYRLCPLQPEEVNHEARRYVFDK